MGASRRPRDHRSHRRRTTVGGIIVALIVQSLALLAVFMPAPASAAPPVVASSLLVQGSGTSFAVTNHGAAAGDLLLVQIVRDGTDSVVAPAGWTEVRTDSLTFSYQSIWYRVADGSESATSTWGFTGTASNTLIATTHLTGTDTTTPIAAHAAQTNSGNDLVAPSVAVPNADSVLLAMYLADDGNPGYSPPTGMTETQDTKLGFVAVHQARETVASAGATGTRTATPVSPTAHDSIGVLLAVNPDLGPAVVLVADAGPPQAITEGDRLLLDGSGSALSGTQLRWDLDNDGQYDDAFGAAPEITWPQLVALGFDDEGGPYPVGLQVDDGGSPVTDTTSFTIANAEPKVTAEGSAFAGAGLPYRLHVDIDDPGDDTVTAWSVNWGDGNVDTGAGSPGTLTHTYANPGTFNDITLSVTDEDGTWIAGDLVVAMLDASDELARYEPETGTRLSDFAASGSLDDGRSLAIGPDGLVYVSSFSNDRVVRFDPADGSFVDTFVASGSGGLSGPKGLAFAADGNLLVASSISAQVLEYDATTGSFVGVFAATGLTSPSGMTLGPDGDLYVTDQTNDTVVAFDADTGTSLGVFASVAAGGRPTDVAFGPDGNLHVTLYDLNRVDEFDGTTGASLGTFASAGVSNPMAIELGPDGAFWVVNYWTEDVRRFDAATGAPFGARVSVTPPAGPSGVAFVPDLQLQVVDALVVDSTADGTDLTPGDGQCQIALSGQCTLRAAIEEANATPGADLIAFSIPVSDPNRSTSPLQYLISPSTALPAASGRTIIDATTQADWAGAPVVRLDGAATSGSTGLSISGDNSEVRGLAVTSFDAGLYLSGSSMVVADNRVGVGVGPGATDLGNAGNGVALDAPDADIIRNVVSGNDGGGLILFGSADRARVEGNIVGLAPDGATAVGNGGEGIELGDLADVRIVDNTITGNAGQGIGAYSPLTRTAIQGNRIGTTADGVSTVGAQPQGILIFDDATDNLVGGTGFGEGNVIAGSLWEGVLITDADADDNAVVGNVIRDTGNLGLDLGTAGVLANDAGDPDIGPNDLLNHPEITGGSVDGGLVILGVDLDVPAGTYRLEFFTNPSGAGSGGYGEGEQFRSSVEVSHPGGGAQSYTVGFPGTAGEIVTATATQASGFWGLGSTSEFSQAFAVPSTAATFVVNSTGDAGDTAVGDGLCTTGGSVGADPECTLRAAIEEANGSATVDDVEFAIPTGDSGYVVGTGTWTLTPASPYPLIVHPVSLDASTQPGWVGTPLIELDGTNATGATAGLAIRGNDSLIRGFIVHSFADEGLEIDGFDGGGDRNTLTNNIVGRDATGASRPNADVGILLTVDASDNTIGGVGTDDGNVVANGNGAGIVIRNAGSDDNTVIGNEVVDNASHGIHVFDQATGNRIGGTTAAEANEIRDNGGDGVSIAADAGAANAIIGNAIDDNAGLGIDLEDDGVTANDANDVDAGPNGLLNFPEIVSATVSGSIVTVDATWDVPAGSYRIELFRTSGPADASNHGEGAELVGSSTLSHPGGGTQPLGAAFAGTSGEVVTMTITQDLGGGSYGASSEFSGVAVVTLPGGSDAVVLDNVQSGTTVLGNGSSAVTATIDAVDPTKAFLTYSVRGNRNAPNDIWTSGELTNATTLTFARDDLDEPVTIEWSVVEFASGVSVQRGQQTLSASTTDVSISAVDLSTSFPLVNQHAPGATFGSDDFFRAELTSSTNLQLALPAATANEVYWQVVTYNDAAVQTGTVSLAAGDSSQSASITSVDTSKAWLTYSVTSETDGTAADIGQKMVRGVVADDTTLTFDRSSTGQPMEVRWYLVEFTDATDVQHASVAFAAPDTTRDVAIAPVDPSRSIAVGGYLQYGGRSSYTADDNPGTGWFTTELTSSSNLRVQRDAALATADLGWFVIHWPCADSDGDGLCDVQEDANTDADGDPSTNPGPNTDGDALPNYLDADDDDDGTLTSAENADPNGDGDPRDAFDSDHDGEPDYRDLPTGTTDGSVADEQKISDTEGDFTAALDDEDWIGHSVASIGDVDGDGVADLATGVFSDDDGASSAGAVYILLLNPDGTVRTEQKISALSGGLTATLDASDRFGDSVAGIGDLDGDGTPDIVVGARSDDDGGSERGAVHVLFLNPDGTVRAEQKISSLSGGLTATIDDSDNFGAAVAGIGDLDGDGILDIAVGARADDDGGTDRGAVHVLFLNADGTVRAEQKISDLAGGFAATLDDVDYFGGSIDGIGDLDGDGILDIAVGAHLDDDGGTDRGAVHVLFLNADGTVRAEQKISDLAGGFATALDDTDRFGHSVSAVGDLDGDGDSDVVIGAVNDDDGGVNRGAVYVVLLDADGTVEAEQKISDTQGGLAATLGNGDDFGNALAGVGDLDRDGTINLAIGARRDDDGGTNRGAVYILDLEADSPPAIVAAADDSESTVVNTATTFDPDDNDVDLNGDAITEIDLTAPTNGTAVLNGDGTVTYTPDAAYTGSDSFDYWAIDAGAALTHHWGLAGNGTDAVGSNDGVLTGTTTVTGDFGQALSFDDDLDNDVVTVPDFALGSDFTISVDIKVDDNTGPLFKYVWSHGDINGFDSINVFLLEDSHGTDPNTLRTVIRDADDSLSNTALEFDAAAIVGDGQWHTYTATVSSTDGIRVYLDGVLRASDGTRGTDGVDPSGSLLLGARQDLAADRFFGGELDTALVFDRALSPAEVLDIAAASNRATVTMTVAPPASCGIDSDGDGLWDCEEDANTDLDNDPSTNPGPNTDGDTFPNYLDADDDGDTAVTASEDADPNGDGDPRDARDTDRDGQPDWLDLPITADTDGTVGDEQKISSLVGGAPALDNSDQFGSSLAPIGDLDGDGVNDLAVGVAGDDDGAGTSGAVYIVFLNADGTVKGTQKISNLAGGLTTPIDVGDTFGVSVTGLGDVDGDGIIDLAVGAHRDDDGGPDRGAVHVLLLNRDGTVRLQQKISDTEGGLAATLVDYDNFGLGTAGPGDIDDDGIPDLVVGAPYADDGGANRGVVHVLFLNADGTVKAEQQISSTSGGFGGTLDNSDYFGIAVAGIDDVDGDGTADLLVGASGDDDGGSGRGAAYVLFLNPDGTVQAEQKLSSLEGGLIKPIVNSDAFGSSVAGVGDLNGDGRTDIAIGAPNDDDGGTNRGGVHLLVLAADGTVRGHHVWSNTLGGLTATLENSDQFGFAVAGLGDLNGDGTPELAIGAPRDDDGGTDRGAVYIVEAAERPAPGAFEVNSTGDTGDTNVGDGICETATAGECTLRAAIEEANATSSIDTVSFAIPTSDPGYQASPTAFTITPAAAYPFIAGPVIIDGTSQAEYVDRPVIELDGSGAGSSVSGLRLVAGSDASQVSALAINGFTSAGIYIEDAGWTSVTDSVLGLDVDGLGAAGNRYGAYISDAPWSTFDGNVISSNTFWGLAVYNDSVGVTITDNLVGTDRTGQVERGNAREGLFVVNNSSGALISGNVVSGNGSEAIYSTSDDVTIIDNRIGLSADETLGFANQTGIEINFASDNRIADNRFGPQDEHAIWLRTSDDAMVTGNLIGTNGAGTATWPTGGAAVRLDSGVDGATIGGTNPADANVITNGGAGGVVLDAAAGSGNRVLGNSIHANVGPGIDLGDDGVTTNDAGDVDTGPNGLLNRPVIDTAIETAAGTVTLEVALDVPAGTYRLEVFGNPDGLDDSGAGEGRTLVTTAMVVHGGTGSESFVLTHPGAVGDLVTLTATDSTPGSTSEFSRARRVTALDMVAVNDTGDAADLAPGDGVCDTGLSNSEGEVACTLRAALAEADSASAVTDVVFDLPLSDGGHSGGIWTISPTIELPELTTAGRLVDGSTQGGWVATPMVAVDGAATTGADGLRLTSTSSGTEVRGLEIFGFDSNAIHVGGDGHTIAGNDLHGAGAAAVYVDDGSANIIGGSTAADRNTIGASANGVVVDGVAVTGVTISGNHIGTSGGHTFDGVRVLGGATGVEIGGASPAFGNVIVDSGGEGVQIEDEATDGVVVRNNLIGVAADGVTPQGNGGRGIFISGGGDNTLVSANVIGDNGLVGITVQGDSTGTVIEANRIGTDLAGSLDLGNNGVGVLLEVGADGSRIGGTGVSQGNVIAHNGSGFSTRHGISVRTGDHAILGNTLFANGGLAIGLSGGVEDGFGVTANDAGDVDTGPNGLLNFPEILSAVEVGGALTVEFSLDVAAGDHRIEVFANPSGTDPSGHGEAEVLLGTADVSHGGGGPELFTISVPGVAGDLLAMTATEDLGGGSFGATSELSVAVTAVAAPSTLTVNSTSDRPDTSPGDGLCATGFTSAGGDSECTLRAALEELNASTVVDTIEFALPVGDAGHSSGRWTIAPVTGLPPVSRSVTLDATTQLGWTDAPVVIVDGGSLPASTAALRVQADDTGLRGLAFENATGAGVVVDGADDVSLLRNSYLDNGDVGIDLDDDGRTANDAGDPDTGANDLLNHPDITAASATGGIVSVDVELDAPAGDYRLEFFSNPTGPDPTGHGEGAVMVGSVDITHPGGGPASSSVAFFGNALDLTVTATENLGAGAFGSTSEFSAAVAVTGSDTLVVNSTGDLADATPGDGRCATGGVNADGLPECTLRAAAEEANAVDAIDRIEFAIPVADAGHVAGVWTISATAAMPAISAPVTIDATTATGFVDRPRIEWDGSAVVDVSADGIFVSSGAVGSEIRGLAVVGWPDDGILVGATDVVIAENHVGVRADGTTAAGNGTEGVIGWLGAERLTVRDNVISANVNAAGIVLGAGADDSVVTGNIVGADITGTVPMPNQNALWSEIDGSIRVGGTAPGEGNLFANSVGRGVTVRGTGSMSLIGNEFVNNGGLGIDLGEDNVTLNDPGDGDSGANDLLNHPEITRATSLLSTVTVTFDLDVPAGDHRIEVFTNPSGADASGYGEGEVYETATTITHTGSGVETFTVTYSGAVGDLVALTATQEFAGPTYGATSEFSETVVVADATVATVNSTGDLGDAVPGDGYCETGGFNADGDTECTLRAAMQEANAAAAVSTIDFDLSIADSNHAGGVWTISPGSALPLISAQVTIDATTEPSFTTTPVVEIDGSAAGAVDGFRLEARTLLRGLAIGGFGEDGVDIGTGGSSSRIVGNHIGVDASGTIPRPNGTGGVTVSGSGTTIGGSTAADRNIISGNVDDGIYLSGVTATGNQILGNHIGTDLTGMVALGNTDRGVHIESGASNNVIGGAATSAANLISGNGSNGVVIGDFNGQGTTGNSVIGNLIGADATGAPMLGNQSHGVFLGPVSGNAIGGSGPGEGNLITDSLWSGVRIGDATAADNAIVANRFVANGSTPIDLGAVGVTPNDAGDVDTGANGLLNHPEIVAVQRVGPDLVVEIDLDVAAGDHRIEFFGNTVADSSGHGEGEIVLGSATITHTGSGPERFTASVPSGPTILTATATEISGPVLGATSEFSAAVPSPDLVVVNSTSDNGDASVGDGRCDTGAVNSEGDPECTLRAAIEEANDPATPVSTVWFSIPESDPEWVDPRWVIAPGSAPLPDVVEELVIDARTQPGWGGKPLIVLHGGKRAAAGPPAVTEDGLVLAADDSAVHGLVVGGWPDDGVVVAGSDVSVTSTWFGLDETDALLPNLSSDLDMPGAGDRLVLGGVDPADGNVFGAGGADHTVELTGSGADHLVQHNRFGVAADGVTSLTPIAKGLLLGGTVNDVVVRDNQFGELPSFAVVTTSDSSDVVIVANVFGTDATATEELPVGVVLRVEGTGPVRFGGTDPADANLVRNVVEDGISVAPGAGQVTILGNSIARVSEDGIDLGGDGPTANDALDVDTGPNDLLNTPVIEAALARGGVVDLTVVLDLPAGDHRIEFFTNPSGSGTGGFGNGEVLVGTALVSHDGTGPMRLAHRIEGAVGDVVTATTTQVTGPGTHGATSEFSAARTAADRDGRVVADASQRRADLVDIAGIGGAPTVAVGSVTGPAADFSGGADRLVGPPLTLHDQALTLAAWVVPDALTGNPRVLARTSAAGVTDHELFIDSATAEAVARVRLDSGLVEVRGGGIVASTRHHLATTWDGAALILYVDGSEVDRIAAAGQLVIDVTVPFTVGNTAGASNGLSGQVDTVLVRHDALGPEAIAAHVAGVTGLPVQAGAPQTGVAAPWTVGSTQTRSGTNALEAPSVSDPGQPAWAVASGLDEPGMVFETWWWLSDNAVDVAAGTRAGAVTAEQYEAAAVASGVELRTESGGVTTVEASSGTNVATGQWVAVEIRTDQDGVSQVFVDGVELIAPTAPGTTLGSGSLGLTVADLAPGEAWYVDDARGRRLVTPEPVASLGPLDRD